MKTIYKVTHNIEKCLHGYDTTAARYFDNLNGAKYLFNSLRKTANLTRDEWVILDALTVEDNELGELKTVECVNLSTYADDTKCGAEYYENV